MIAVAGPAVAGQAIAASVEDLARSSELVVHGRVVGTTARWTEDGGRIFSFVEVEVLDAWRGTAGRRITVAVPGGQVDGVGQRVSGAPDFQQGEEIVVFLRRAEAGAHRVNGLAQGKFRVVGSEARPDLSGLEVHPAPIRSGERRAEAMPLDELRRRVKGLH
jgi:hypothetical protein